MCRPEVGALPGPCAAGCGPPGDYWTQASDIDMHAREILKTRESLNEILSRHTGQSIERIQQDTDRDYFMSPGEAKEYGLIDEIYLPSEGKAGKKKQS